MEVGKDPLGNLQRISNALTGIEKKLSEAQSDLETVQQQLATAEEEVLKPFAKEAELSEKTKRLSELNALLNMDQKGPQEALGMDDEQEVAERPRKFVNLAGRVSEHSQAADEAGKQAGDFHMSDKAPGILPVPGQSGKTKDSFYTADKLSGICSAGGRDEKQAGAVYRPGRTGKEPGNARAGRPVKKSSVLGRLKEAKQRIAAGCCSGQKISKKKGQEL